MKEHKRLVSVIAVWSSLALTMASHPAAAQETAGAKPAKPTPATSPYTGVKKRIAVGKFDATAATTGYFMNTDIGAGVAAQLVTALVESGRFLVLERATSTMAEIERERQLESMRRSAAGTDSPAAPPRISAPNAGAPDPTGPDPSAPVVVAPSIDVPASKLIDAQMLIVGSVTEFEQAAKGGGWTVGGLGAAVGRTAAEGHVGMDIRLLDASTGQVLISKHVKASVPESKTTVGVTSHNINLGDETFKKTALGIAMRSAIEQAVELIIGKMEAIPWRGQVADLLDNQVLVNAGRDMALQPGMILIVSTIAKQVTDPVTGWSLGAVEAPLGEIQIEQVQDKFSTARVVAGPLPKRGDLLRLKQ